MKRFAAMMLAALLAASSTTVAFAAKNYDYIGFGGWVTLDYDAMDGGNVLVPGNTYTFPILDGSSSFNEESADVWRISASEYVPLDDEGKRGTEKFSSVSVDKGSDGKYYLTVKVKQNRDTYYSEQDAFILLKVEEKGIDREDAEINSAMASRFEADTQTFFTDLDDDASYGTSRTLTLSNLQRYSETYPTDFSGGFISGESYSSISGKLASEDRVYYTTISVEEFEIASTDYDVIDDDKYDVDNSMPLVMAGGDVSKSTLSFGNVAEYLAKFSTKEKAFNLSYSTVTNSAVAGANPNAKLRCITFPGTPMFAANSYLVIKDKDMKYLYEVDGDELIELKTTTQDGYLAYRTDRLTSYIASDRALKNAVSSSSSSSTSSSSTSGGSTSSKPNPDTGR